MPCIGAGRPELRCAPARFTASCGPTTRRRRRHADSHGRAVFSLGTRSRDLQRRALGQGARTSSRTLVFAARTVVSLYLYAQIMSCTREPCARERDLSIAPCSGNSSAASSSFCFYFIASTAPYCAQRPIRVPLAWRRSFEGGKETSKVLSENDVPELCAPKPQSNKLVCSRARARFISGATRIPLSQPFCRLCVFELAVTSCGRT